MSTIEYDFFIYVNSTSDLTNFCTLVKNTTVSYSNYNVQPCLYRYLPSSYGFSQDDLTNNCNTFNTLSEVSESITSGLTANTYTNPMMTASTTCSDQTIAYNGYPSNTNYFPVNSLPTGQTTFASSGLKSEMSIYNDVLPKLSINSTKQFVTFRNMTCSDSGPKVYIPNNNQTNNSLTYYNNNTISGTPSGGFSVNINNGQSQQSTTGNGIYYNNNWVLSLTLPSQSTSGIGCKYFSPVLGTSNPSQDVTTSNSSNNNLIDYPIGTKYETGVKNSANNNEIDVDNFYLCIQAGIVCNIGIPQDEVVGVIEGNAFDKTGTETKSKETSQNQVPFGFTGIAIPAYPFNSCSASQFFDDSCEASLAAATILAPVDILCSGSPKLKVGIYQLKTGYNKAPNISNGYTNPFENLSQSSYGYYNYGIFKNPTVSFFLGEQSQNATENLPSALFKISYKINKSDLLQSNAQYQIMDLLNFYNFAYSLGKEFYQETLADSYSVPLSGSTMNTLSQTTAAPTNNYGTVSRASSYPNPMYRYWLNSCQSAKSLIIDYCNASGSMSSTICSEMLNGSFSLQYLNLYASPCTSIDKSNDFSQCAAGWKTYCTDTSTFLSKECTNYFQGSLVDDEKYMNEATQEQLRTVCANYYNAQKNTTNLSNTFYNTCGCFMPDSVYTDYLKEYEIYGQPVGPNQCWYPPCASSSIPLMNKINLNCPNTSVATCVQKSMLNLVDENGNIMNNNFSVDQVLSQCANSQNIYSEDGQVKDSDVPTVPPAPTLKPGSTTFTIPTSDLTPIVIPSPYYPKGFVITVLGIFTALLLLIVGQLF